MTVAKLSAVIGLVTAIAASIIGAQQYVHAQVAQAKQETKAAVSFAQATHRMDVYEAKTEVAAKHLELLREIQADPDKIDAAKKEYDFWREQTHRAREAITE